MNTHELLEALLTHQDGDGGNKDEHDHKMPNGLDLDKYHYHQELTDPTLVSKVMEFERSRDEYEELDRKIRLIVARGSLAMQEIHEEVRQRYKDVIRGDCVSVGITKRSGTWHVVGYRHHDAAEESRPGLYL